MVRTRDVTRFLKPLAERHSDIRIVGRWIVFVPVRHVVKGIVAHQGASADKVTFKYCVWHLFDGTDGFCGDYWRYVRGLGAPRFKSPDLFAHLENEINTTLRPFFQSIDTIEDYVAYTNDPERFKGNWLFAWPLRRCLVKLALGDLEGAREVIRLTEPKGMIASDYFRKVWPGVYERLKYEIAPLLEADDRTGIIRFLHAAERRSVENIGIAQWHEVTPFLTELQSG